MFSGTMGQANVSPYYYKANGISQLKDITLSTLVTSDRIPVLSRLASHYKGPISATIHIQGEKETILEQLAKAYRENEDMERYVDVHLITDHYERQFNMWRNVAKMYARTDYIMMLDIDFFPCTDFRQEILNDKGLLDKLNQGSGLVVPAFEYSVLEEGLDYRVFPRTKSDLIQKVEEGKLDMFHKSWQRGHGSTNYVKWYSYQNSSSSYPVIDYNHSYEPYVIFKRQQSPWCDERFIGYGANKAACLFEFYISGMEYHVLSNHFLIHQSHDYPESTRRKERLFNRRLYTHFREEVCLRYARKFISDETWESRRADNLKNECQKIHGFSSFFLSAPKETTDA
ncbi:glycosyl-transferase for dystroglycan-domain-containing protein [Sporodiniella umbellata]|nr:glycosyl-transferase for dystroglycan-domain-containing protein [Sporodiniella umbellata]